MRAFLDFIDASPSPFHAVASVAALLAGADYSRLDERDVWPREAGRFFVVRGGSIVAWQSAGRQAPFRVVGAHTDSPNLRLKPHPDATQGGLGMLNLEPYGSPILESWLDRDLGISGRVVTADGNERLVRDNGPLVRVPRLAIHLSRGTEGEPLNPQRHLAGLWSIDSAEILGHLGCPEAVAFDLMVHDVQPAALVGRSGALISAPRLDNLASCFAAVQGLLAASPGDFQPLIALFDHEEVGSASERGAHSDLLPTILERITGGEREDYHRAVADSIVASADMAHATHPSYPELHEPLHQIRLGGGPVLKVNQNLRYASEPRGTAAFVRACEQAGVPLQRYAHRADLPCGSTIGPATAARTGIITVDVGAPQLSMHSARETMAVADLDFYLRTLGAFLSPA
jgi:aspartyl aminopeptidase